MPARPVKKASPSSHIGTDAHPYFTPAAIDFLRKLKRNNRREWFEARRSTFERELKQPMLALVEAVTRGMEDYAPDHLRPAHKSVMRIYRDTRFSADKTPYKTRVAAWWTRNGLDKTSGAGYYLHLAPDGLVIAAGVYMPGKDQLLAIRRHLLAHHAEFKRLIEDKKLRAKLSLDDQTPLTRPPKGFAPDHPAIEWIKWRQWGVIAALPAEEALKPSLAATVTRYFRLSYPLVDFLNQPLAPLSHPAKKPLFALSR